MSLRKLLLGSFIDLWVGKIVLKGTYVRVSVHNLPIEFKNLVENNYLKQEVIFHDDKLEKIFEKLGIEEDYDSILEDDIIENLTGEPNHLYKCLPNKIFSAESLLGIPNKISLETKHNVIIENLRIEKVRQFTNKIKYNKSNIKISNGCLIGIYSYLNDCVLEYNLQPIPIKEFQPHELCFYVEEYEILETLETHRFFGDVYYSGKRYDKQIIYKGTKESYYYVPNWDKVAIFSEQKAWQ